MEKPYSIRKFLFQAFILFSAIIGGYMLGSSAWIGAHPQEKYVCNPSSDSNFQAKTIISKPSRRDSILNEFKRKGQRVNSPILTARKMVSE